MQVINSRYPFPSIPDRSEILSILPSFRHPPIILWGTDSYWLAVGNDAKTIGTALACPVCYRDENQDNLHWLVFGRDTLDPRGLKWHTPQYRGYPMQILWVG